MGNKSKSKKRVKASTNEAKVTCPKCDMVINYDMSTTNAEGRLEMHYAFDCKNPNVKVVDKDISDDVISEPEPEPAPEPVKAAAEAVEEAPRQGVPAPPKDKKTPCPYCNELVTTFHLGRKAHVNKCRKDHLAQGSLEDIRNVLRQLAVDIVDDVQEIEEQAQEDAAFFDEIELTKDTIKMLKTERLPMYEDIEEDYRSAKIKAKIKATKEAIAVAQERLADMMNDPRFTRGKSAAKKVILRQAKVDAQEEASQHNNEKRQIPVNAASNWIAENATRFDRMYHGELWVPSRARLFFIHEDLCPCTTDRDASCTCEGDYPKYGSLPFMRDTLWKAQSTAKEKFDLKKVSQIRPEHLRDVWPEVFKQQMERYSFKETENFSVDTAKAVVGDSGEIKMVPATFTETARVPFTEWSSMMLNSILKIHKECKGEDIMSVLTRRNLAGKDGSIEVLPEAFVASWFVKTNVQLTAVQHAWHKAVNAKKNK